jgi:hypothetical protein
MRRPIGQGIICLVLQFLVCRGLFQFKVFRSQLLTLLFNVGCCFVNIQSKQNADLGPAQEGFSRCFRLSRLVYMKPIEG